MPGDCGANTWSFTINTSEYDFWNDSYSVYAISGKTIGEGFFMIRDPSLPQLNEESFIRINAVPHHYIGDTIIFQGTTNIPAREEITLRIFEAYSHCSKGLPRNDSVDGCHGDGIPATVIVAAGDWGTNTWSWKVNTSQHGFGPDSLYFISARYVRNATIGNESYFELHGIPQPNITFTLPENDPHEYALRFSGQVNTGNGPDEKLLLQITSDSGARVSYTIPVFLNGTGYYWNYTLKKSTITPYNFYTVNISSLTNPEIGYRNTFRSDNTPEFS